FSALVFKVATACLVAIALTLGGLYAYNVVKSRPKETYIPPVNAPLVGMAKLHEYVAEEVNAAEGERLTGLGDTAWHSGSLDAALAHYTGAWQQNPTPA